LSQRQRHGQRLIIVYNKAMYSSLEIDHIFRIVRDDEHALQMIEELGFDPKKTKITVHTGQGTSARFVFFEQNYLEFIYLRDKEESRHCPLNIGKRIAHWESSNGMPYGVGLRGVLSPTEKEDFKAHKPDYGNYTLYLHKSVSSDLTMPEVFLLEVEGRPREQYFPKNFGEGWNELIHKSTDLKEFSSAVLTCHGLKPQKFGNFEIQEGLERSLLINGKFSF